MRRMRTAPWALALLLVVLTCLAPSVARADDDVVSAQGDPIEFVYLDYTAVAPGDEQNIVVAFAEDVVESRVRIRDLGTDECLDIAPSVVADGSALYTVSFDEPALYQLVSVSYRLAGDGEDAWRTVEFGDDEACLFRVTTAVADDGVSALSTDDGPSVLFSSFDEEGNLVESSSLSGVSESALDGRAAVEDTTVVLDPGHGGYDPGASGNGLVEKDLTLSIALYCRDELTQYAHTIVDMTRSDDTFVDLLPRAEYARDAGADLFVSIHINAGGGTGSEVWIPNDSSWHYEFHEIGDELGDRILERLEALGLSNRGNKDRDYGASSNPNGTYEDGSMADYLSVIRNCRRFGIPAVLVEYGFIDNASDAAFMAQDSNRKDMGVATAQAIVEQLGLELPQPLYGFTDVFDTTPHVTEIGWLASSGISTGWEVEGGREFRGGLEVKRQDMAAFLYRMAGSPDYEPTAADRARFSDVSDSTPHAKEVWWLASTGISTGYPNGRFGVGDPVLRQDMAAFLRRFTALFIDSSVTDWEPSSSQLDAFTDVTSATPHYEDILWLASAGVSTGYEDGTFGVGKKVVRQDMAAFLYRVNDLPAYEPSEEDKEAFLDVDSSTPHANDVWWLASSGISTGWEVEGGREFRGGLEVKRQDMAAFLYRMAGSPDYEPTAADRARFSDVSDSTPHAKEVWWLASTGISTGYPNGRFGVGDPVLRQDMAAFLRRFYDNVCSGNMYSDWPITDAVKVRFSDVTSSTPHAEDIWWLAATGISTGYEDGTFGGDSTILRQDMAAFLYRLDVRSERMTERDAGLPESAASYSIMGTSSLSEKQMVSLFRSKGHAYPSSVYSGKGAATIEDFVRIVIEEATDEGVRADIVFCQAMHETGWLQFGGDVSAGQCNFAGIGAVGGGAAGHTFKDVREGIRGQVQHLKAYAVKDPKLAHDCVDPRFHLVNKGSAPMLADLGGKWATGTDYGNRIFALIVEASSL